MKTKLLLHECLESLHIPCKPCLSIGLCNTFTIPVYVNVFIIPGFLNVSRFVSYRPHITFRDVVV